MTRYKDTFDKKVDGYGLTLGADDGSTWQLSSTPLGQYDPELKDEFTFDVVMKMTREGRPALSQEHKSVYANFTREALTELRDYINSRLDAN